MAGNTSFTFVTMNPNPVTGSGYIYIEPEDDPKANKCLTEKEIGKLTMWTWKGAYMSVSSTYCPKFSTLTNASYNTISATGTLNDGTTESSYNIVSNTGVTSTKLLKKSDITLNKVSFVFNARHYELNYAPADYSFEFYLSNDTGTTKVCSLGSVSLTKAKLGKNDWHDFVIDVSLKDYTNSTDDALKRDAYLCISGGNSSWDFKRNFLFGIVKYNSATGSWVDYKTSSKDVTMTKFGDGVKTINCNLGVKWRELIANRYRIVYQLLKS